MSDGQPVYVGQTSRDMYARAREHYEYRRQTARWNPGLAEWLTEAGPYPEVVKLETVEWFHRYQAEAAWTRKLRKSHPLFNIAEGNSRPHTAESKRKISLGLRAYYAAT